MNHLNSKSVLKIYYVFSVLSRQTLRLQTFVRVFSSEVNLAFFL
jgi:hypothetical protein